MKFGIIYNALLIVVFYVYLSTLLVHIISNIYVYIITIHININKLVR